jgi:hypothetical protein
VTLLLVAGLLIGAAAFACVMVRYCQNESRRDQPPCRTTGQNDCHAPCCDLGGYPM